MNKYAQMADRLYDQEQQMKRLEEENKELKEVHESDKRSLRLIAEKGADLEREISILLSCKNCSENKGGYICQKEYEDKCLAQKIQYIKELQEENAELKRDKEDLIFIRNQKAKCMCKDKERFAYAKTIIQDLLNNSDEYARQRAIDFLKGSENE